MARFFLRREDITGDHAVIIGQELEHLRRVLRLTAGDRITGFDQSGWEHDAIIRALTSERADLQILRTYRCEREPPLAVILAIGLMKGDKMDFVVEKATELGATSIAPFVSAHAVPKLDTAKAKKRKERWEKIALSAAKQCGRARIPTIAELCDFSELVQQSQSDAKLLFWEKTRERGIHQLSLSPQSILVATGPEGGFSDAEAEFARAHDFELVGLGPRVLRAETAALAALSLIQFRWGDLG